MIWNFFSFSTVKRCPAAENRIMRRIEVAKPLREITVY